MERYECEVVKFLELRQRLKESIREQRRMTPKASTILMSYKEENKIKLPSDDNYGSFFGHSQPLIAKQVIQDNKSLSSLHSASILFNKKNENKVSKCTLNNQLPIVYDVKLKVQKIKESRDYSFLLSDDDHEVPAPTKEHARLEAQPADKQPLSSGVKLGNSGSVGGKLTPKAAGSNNNKTASTIASADSRKHLGNNSVKKRPISKAHSSVEERKDNTGLTKATDKMPVASSVHQKSQPLTEVPAQQHPKKKRVRRRCEDEEEYEDENQRAISMIREMFRYDPNKYVDDDEDDRNMVASFHAILKEERSSARIARREDAEQLRLIEEEERYRKRRITKSKKLKLCKH